MKKFISNYQRETNNYIMKKLWIYFKPQRDIHAKFKKFMEENKND